MRSSFVVVANRLPVDEVEHRIRARMAAQPGRPGHRAASGAGGAARHLGRLVRWRHRPDRPSRHRRGTRSTGRPISTTFVGRRHRTGAGRPVRGRDRALLRGLLQRQPVAAVPRRGGDPGLSSATGGTPTAGQPALRRRRPRGRGRGRDGLGAGLPAAARAGDAARRRPDLRIGFFLHIPFPPVELFMQLPRRVEILAGCSAPTWSASSGRSAPRTSCA